MQEVEKLRAQAASGDHKAAGKVPEAERALADKDAALKGELCTSWAKVWCFVAAVRHRSTAVAAQCSSCGL